MPRLFALAALMAVVVGLPVSAGGPRTGVELVGAMHERYAGSWYRTLTFVQQTVRVAPDGKESNETWYEAWTPGRLRIDFAPLASGNGVLFADDVLSRVEAGAVTRTLPFVHPLMVLGFDVYVDPVDRSLARLATLKVDLTVLREDTWQGRPVYVVGAPAGDLKTRQFWVDRETLLFVRWIETQTGRDGAVHLQEVQFNKYERAGGGWIAPEVLIFEDGRLVTREVYSEIRAGGELPDGLLDPARWTSVRWRSV